jgi:hypothetical protein
MQTSKNSRRISAEFFAQGYRVSGTYSIQKRLLADAIYDPTTNYLMLEDAYVSPISDPARISAHYAQVLFDKSNLDFVLTVNKRDGLRRDQTYGMGSYQYAIFLTVPFFEVTGELHTASKTFHPRSYLSTDAGTFISLLNVTARSTFNPDISYQGSVALISRAQISFFGEQTEQ